MTIICPKCKTRYQLKDDVKAAKVRCKKCQTIIDVKNATVSELKPTAEQQTVVGIPPEPTPAEKSQAETIVPSANPETPIGKPAEQKTVVGAPPEPAATDKSQAKTMVPPAKPETPTPRPADQKTLLSELAEEPEAGSEEAGPSDPLIGKTLGGYEIVRKLGQGGMGAVYDARQLSLDRHIALKVLPAQLAANKEFIRRFIREALSVAKLNHNNIIQIYDVGKEEDTYYFSMEFVKGRTLDAMIEPEGKMAPETAVGYVIQAARGLEYSHRKNIIHRDIKPENIMINEEGVAKVADLGLAKQVDDKELSVTMSGVAMGTPHYMSPEQASDAKQVDHRADIYSLGCTLYHLVTGKVPYSGESAFEIITKHVNEPLTLPHVIVPDVPEELSGIVGKMMAKQKEERYQTMADVIEALEEYLGVNYAKAGFQPSEEQISTIQEHARNFEAVRNKKTSSLVLLGISALAVLLAIVAIAVGSPRFLLGVVAYGLLAPVFYAVLFGSIRKTYLYRRARKFLFGNRISDWLVILLVLVVAVGLVIVLNLILAVVLALVCAAGTAVGYYWAIKKPLLAKQDAVIEDIKKSVRDIRRKGIPETAIHVFVCRHGGAYGELICEEMFGYDAVLGTRARRNQEELEKRRFATRLREWAIGRLHAAEVKREQEKEARKAAVEEKLVAAKTAVMPGQAQAAAEEDVLEALEEKKAGLAALAAGIPKFIIGPKGRVTIAAIMILLSAVSFRRFAFADSAALQSPNYLLFAAALLMTGFLRSVVSLGCLVLTCIISGPVAAYADKIAPFLANRLVLLREARDATADAAAQPDIVLTPLFFAGLFFFILAIIAAFILKPKKAESPTEDAGKQAA